MVIRSIAGAFLGVGVVLTLARLVSGRVTLLPWWFFLLVGIGLIIFDLVRPKPNPTVDYQQAIAAGRSGVQRWESAAPTGQRDAAGNEYLEYVSSVGLANGRIYRRVQRGVVAPESFNELGIGGYRAIIQPEEDNALVVAATGQQAILPQDPRLQLLPESGADVPPWPGVSYGPARDADSLYPYADPTRIAETNGKTPGDKALLSWIAAIGLFLVSALGTGLLYQHDFSGGNADAVPAAEDKSPSPTAEASDPAEDEQEEGDTDKPGESKEQEEAAGVPSVSGLPSSGFPKSSAQASSPARAEEVPGGETEDGSDSTEESDHLNPNRGEDLRVIFAGLEAIAGSEEVSEVTIYQEYSTAVMAIEPGSDKWDQIRYSLSGRFENAGAAIIQPRPDMNKRFSFADLDPNVLARLLSQVYADSGYKKSEVTSEPYLKIEHLLWGPYANELTIRAYIGDDYGSAMVWYSKDGKKLQVSRS